jgi:hypothetical protein
MEGLIRGERANIHRLLEPLRKSDRYRELTSGGWPGFPPTDLDLSLTPDRFDFAMPIARRNGYLQLTAAPAPTGQHLKPS